MAGCDIDAKQVLREIDALVDDFKTLRLASAKGTVRTDREAMWSLSPIAKPVASTIGLARRNFKPHPSHWMGGLGVELGDIKPSTYSEMESAQTHYARQTGVPFVNSVGESLVLSSGWSSWHEIHLSGDHAKESRDVIKRANAWVNGRKSIIYRALFYGRDTTFNDCCWPDIALMVGELPDADATMSKPKWSVEIGWVYFNPDADGNPRLSPSFERMVQSVSVEMWKKRKAEDWQCFGRCEPFASITEADELFIGDPPEVMYCEQELKPFLRDSELALDWLRRWIEDSMRDAIPSEPIPSAELKQSNAAGLNKKSPAKMRSPGRKPKELTKEEKEIRDLWKSGRFLTLNDLDEHRGVDWGETKKLLDALRKRRKRAEERTK
ncbi:hypothetical protein VN12_10565 [Pirellula sp. SH-Sr6A]|uniref:hypothetical protein n=1 Tax=Pirellula sp. SH-Sr6A TaxID=1632865 RepID=UPI00078B7B0B|nr:hypothetical protein [Pirellula sp. SH-Sr6A]AMV32558.1 hypothetical protein VN12_10565 [Pirellula sp. SH-Sr6A]